MAIFYTEGESDSGSTNILWASTKKAATIEDCWSTRTVQCTTCTRRIDAFEKEKKKRKSSDKKKAKAPAQGVCKADFRLRPLDGIGVPALLVLGTHGVESKYEMVLN